MAATPRYSSAKEVLSGDSPILMPCGARKSGITSCSHKVAVISRKAGWSNGDVAAAQFRVPRGGQLHAGRRQPGVVEFEGKGRQQP